ncbi:MAG: hypothetical protein JWM02_698 [Frankiales bacterium]|nr:hypothetical protein [Frankiales bacterium]
MLTSINPLGERGRGYRWGPTVALFGLASLVGGATTGLVLGALGELIAVPVWVGVAACAAAVLLDLSGRVPTWHRQVDEDWLTRYRRWVYASGFGWQLGTGVVTIVTSAVTYALLVLMVMSGPWTSVLAGGLFGLVRALPVLAGWQADTPARLRAVALRLETGRRPAHLVTVATTALAAAALGLS